MGNVTQVESTANVRGQNLLVGANFQIPARRVMLFANYAWLNQESDADGAFSVPANSYDLSNEWAPVMSVPRHNVSAMLSAPLFNSVRLALNGNYRIPFSKFHLPCQPAFTPLYRRSIIRKYGSARAASMAATPKAVGNP